MQCKKPKSFAFILSFSPSFSPLILLARSRNEFRRLAEIQMSLKSLLDLQIFSLWLILPYLVLIYSEFVHECIQIKTNMITHHSDSIWPSGYRPDPRQTITFGFPPIWLKIKWRSHLLLYWSLEDPHRFLQLKMVWRIKSSALNIILLNTIVFSRQYYRNYYLRYQPYYL